MKRTTLMLLSLLAIAEVQAQTLERQVIGASGGSYAAGALQVDHTSGETATASGTAGSFSVYQGFQQTTTFPTSVADQHLPVRFSLYPNPASDQITLSLQNALPIDLKLSLTTVTGQVLFADTDAEQAGQNYSRVISLKSLASGTYFLNLYNAANGPLQQIQFVKQ